MSKNDLDSLSPKTLERIVSRAQYYATQMIYTANKREKTAPGEPKVGGHPATCASGLHIAAALHLFVKTGFDFMACKPHGSPLDHSYNFLLDLLLDSDQQRLSETESEQSMKNLRKFSENGEAVFQSYHSKYDPDRHNFLPSGTVGIPPVNLGYLALAYKYAREHGYIVPDAHFWAIIGDAEFKEGSLAEAAPDLSARELGQVTWIVDYNRQSLDGHRLGHPEIFDGTDDHRIEKMMSANGWEVTQLRHGQKRDLLFEKKHGKSFQVWLEQGLSDFELQTLLQIKKPEELVRFTQERHKELAPFLGEVTPQEFSDALFDLGGHDITKIIEALQQSKRDKRKPSLIIAHTIKGWGLDMAALAGNHSALPSAEEMTSLMKSQGLSEQRPFQRFSPQSPEGKFLEHRGGKLYKDILAQKSLKQTNEKLFEQKFSKWPETFDINLKWANYPHTQWMLGQITSKLTRIANSSMDPDTLNEKGNKPLSPFEKSWREVAELLVSMAPDVGTSTNLNPSMDGKVFGQGELVDLEEKASVGDKKAPNLIPGQESSDRFLRFDIEEGNVMSCAGSFGQLKNLLGIPVMPLMTVYDFFVKRALDQFFYNLYWGSEFICVGTPSGVTLSYEGAQHGWKSDFQIPNQITWEPFFCQELDWIFADTIRRHMTGNNNERTGVHIRTVTKGVQQKDLLKNLKKQKKFKKKVSSPLQLPSFPVAGGVDENSLETISENEILAACRQDVLNGAYFLVNYEGYAGYEPGDNVIHLFALGAMGTEALKASEKLLERGIYANVIIVTSPELLVGNLAHKDGYKHLKEELGIRDQIHLSPSHEKSSSVDWLCVAGRRVPIVSVHDGEPGLLDNIGSIVGVKQEALAVRKHSLCGGLKPIYRFHEIDSEAIVAAAEKVLSATALEPTQVSPSVLKQLQVSPPRT